MAEKWRGARLRGMRIDIKPQAVQLLSDPLTLGAPIKGVTSCHDMWRTNLRPGLSASMGETRYCPYVFILSFIRP